MEFEEVKRVRPCWSLLTFNWAVKQLLLSWGSVRLCSAYVVWISACFSSPNTGQWQWWGRDQEAVGGWETTLWTSKGEINSFPFSIISYLAIRNFLMGLIWSGITVVNFCYLVLLRKVLIFLYWSMEIFSRFSWLTFNLRVLVWVHGLFSIFLSCTDWPKWRVWRNPLSTFAKGMRRDTFTQP